MSAATDFAISCITSTVHFPSRTIWYRSPYWSAQYSSYSFLLNANAPDTTFCMKEMSPVVKYSRPAMESIRLAS